MLLTKKERHQQVRPISRVTEYRVKRDAHCYRLKQYAELIKLGMTEALANAVFIIWENGCKTADDRAILDKVSAFLDRRLKSVALKRHAIAA